MPRTRKRERNHLIKDAFVTRVPLGKTNNGSVGKEFGRWDTRNKALVHATGQKSGLWVLAGMKMGTPSWKVSPLERKSHILIYVSIPAIPKKEIDPRRMIFSW